MMTCTRLHLESPEIPDHHPIVTTGPNEPPASLVDAQLCADNDVERMSKVKHTVCPHKADVGAKGCRLRSSPPNHHEGWPAAGSTGAISLESLLKKLTPTIDERAGGISRPPLELTPRP
jgi:hypothetical protein